MSIDNKKIEDIIMEILQSNEGIFERTSKIMNIKDEVKHEITEFCRKANPIEFSRKLNIPLEVVESYLDIFQNNQDVKELMFMVIGTKKPIKEEIEKLLLKYIGESYEELESY